MRSEPRARPSFWRTAGILLGAARKRAAGRRRRQQQLLQNRAGKSATNWSGVGFAFAVLFMIALHIWAAFGVRMAVETGELVEVEREGKIVVNRWFLDAAKAATESPSTRTYQAPPPNYAYEASNLAERYGGDKKAIEQKLRDAVRDHGTRDFVSSDDAAPGMTAFLTSGPFAPIFGSMVLLLWAVMLVFQGEGLELDLQRRRHPMWEWLFSHPVPAGAVFFAEMFSPIAANPIYWGAPLFVGFLYGAVYDSGLAILSLFLVGVPVTIAAACLGKALEIGVILRFSPRSRGAMVGIMGWLGYASMMMFFFGALVMPKIATAVEKYLNALTVLPWPWLRLFLGGQADGSFSFVSGVLACWLASGITIAGAIRFSVWGAQQGLTGNFAAADARPSASRIAGARFGKEPLYRKEFLWFIRDRSAIVQTILIPLTVASFQLFNLRGVLRYAEGAWNYLCGAAILFGTYFLWILGPKSLSSEGSALWIGLTWPRGLESLLKAKAWLWSLISSGIVGLVLCYAAFVYPAERVKILLVGICWFIFARSMAEKTVTLVTVPSSSGEQEKIPWGRRMAAQLGMLTFAIGVLSQQWHVAFMGIVYSYITAAAMWQNFRARLPYLYDPWSEKLPPPPTLMHAMIAISILVEAGAVIAGIVVAAAGGENIGMALAIGYGVCAVAVSIGVYNFLNNRGVPNREIWRWEPAEAAGADARRWWFGAGAQKSALVQLLVVAAAGGALLGILAHGYLEILLHIPASAEIIRTSQEAMAKIPGLKISYAVMAVGFAPFAEEYLFRGLLYRALDREWGGWRAVVGSAAFFAIYHPPLAWVPVALLGAINALLFKKTGRLAPAVVLHMVYNAVVLA